LRFCRRDCTPPKEDAFEAPFRSLGVESRRKLAPSAPSMDLCLSHIKKSSGGASAWRVQAPPVCMYLTGGPSMSHLFIFGSLSSFEALGGTTGLQLPSALRLAASLRHLHSRNPSAQVNYCFLQPFCSASRLQLDPSVSPPRQRQIESRADSTHLIHSLLLILFRTARVRLPSPGTQRLASAESAFVWRPTAQHGQQQHGQRRNFG
jgi:hypothetical protein